ncbi:MAG: 30S ribosomal protein S16 [Parasporobacterium sp.]|nr:30S ribosomal protein S16 [Parasporobacterium sp.]
MAVKIRLRRMGKKKAPFYRIVVADSRSPRDGRFIEEIGTYDPNQEPSAVVIDKEAAEKWLQNGAQPTDIVAKLFKGEGIAK